MRGRRIRRGLLLAGGTLAVLVPASAASATCVARPLASKTIGSTATRTVLSLPGFLRATLVCSTVRGRQGLRGIRGVTGSTGARGRQGLIGATGLQGVVGATGPIGLQGLAGTNGSAGQQGSQGVAGAPGAAGANGLIRYASIYNEGTQNVAVGGTVDFDTNGPMSAGFTHTVGDSSITVANAGTYEIRFVITAIQANQIAVLVNGAARAGGVFGVGDPQAQNTGQGIFTLAAGDVVALQNHTSLTSIDLQTNAGGNATNENASLLIEQLA